MDRALPFKVLILLAPIMLSACNQQGEPKTASISIDQKNICEVKDWRREATADCKEGQKIVYLPSSWGNAQLPILFTTVNCDHRFSIALTEGAVSCIYTQSN